MRELAVPSSKVLAPSRAAVLLSLFVAGFSTFLNLYATQPLLPEFRQLFGASELMVSLTVCGPVLAVALTAPLLGVLADALGRKRVIVAAMLGLAIPTALAATSSNLGQLIAWRFVQGIFVPGVITVAMAYISEEVPSHIIGSTMSIYITGGVVGGFSGRFLTGVLAHHWGWRIPFVVLGVITVAGALLTWGFLPRARKFIRQKDWGASHRSVRMHLCNPQLLATYAVGFSVLFCMVAAFTYINFYLADKPFELGPAALGLIFSVYLIGAAITPTAGRFLDKFGYRRVIMAAAAMMAAGMLLTLVRSIPVIIVGMALGATGVFVSQAAASSNVGKAAKSARSSAAGLYVSLYYLGGCTGSILPGLFWDRTGWPGCVAVIICMQSITALIAYRLWKD